MAVIRGLSSICQPIKETILQESNLRFVIEPHGIGYLEDYGISYPDHGLARNADQAVTIADRLGYPVVLKIVSPNVPHKSDAGGVLTGVLNSEEVRQGYERILVSVAANTPGAAIEGMLICRQAAEGLEVIVGGFDDEVFGPVVMFGLGGIYTEVFKDVSFGIAPLEEPDAKEMLRQVKGYSLLQGVRGQEAKDINRLSELLIKMSQLMIDRKNIKQLDLNPVRVYENGLIVLDVRIFETKT